MVERPKLNHGIINLKVEGARSQSSTFLVLRGRRARSLKLGKNFRPFLEELSVGGRHQIRQRVRAFAFSRFSAQAFFCVLNAF